MELRSLLFGSAQLRCPQNGTADGHVLPKAPLAGIHVKAPAQTEHHARVPPFLHQRLCILKLQSLILDSSSISVGSKEQNIADPSLPIEKGTIRMRVLE